MQKKYRVTDCEHNQIIICRRNRHYLYRRGIAFRLRQLVETYHLDHIEYKEGDVFIDCGANVGELGFWAKENKLRYYPVEPEELEAECCNLNIFDGASDVKNRALWKENAIVKLYSKPDWGDSSLFKIQDYSSTKEVESVTLEKFVEECNLKKIHVLKIEAEGAEPEILEGAIPVLSKVKYVVVDCGYERGLEEEHTFIEVNNILLGNNFELIQAELKRVVMLYRNTAFIED